MMLTLMSTTTMLDSHDQHSLLLPLCRMVPPTRKLPRVADLMWRSAWNHRLNVTGMTTAQLYYQAEQTGIQSAQIPAIVEQVGGRCRDGCGSLS
jgi:hypothetical protein